MQRLVLLTILLSAIVFPALYTATGAQHPSVLPLPVLPLQTGCVGNTRTTCNQARPATNALLICLIAGRPQGNGCPVGGLVVEIAQSSKALAEDR